MRPDDFPVFVGLPHRACPGETVALLSREALHICSLYSACEGGAVQQGAGERRLVMSQGAAETGTSAWAGPECADRVLPVRDPNLDLAWHATGRVRVGDCGAILRASSPPSPQIAFRFRLLRKTPRTWIAKGRSCATALQRNEVTRLRVGSLRSSLRRSPPEHISELLRYTTHACKRQRSYHLSQ